MRVPKPSTIPADGTQWTRRCCVTAIIDPNCLAKSFLKAIVSSSTFFFLFGFGIASDVLPLGLRLEPKRDMSVSMGVVMRWAEPFLVHVPFNWALMVGAVIAGP